MSQELRQGIWRRHLLGAMAAALVAPLLPPLPARAQAAEAEPWHVLPPSMVELLEAILSRLIPSDDLGPGARDAGVARFIDRQLAGAWGEGEHFYAAGPHHPGLPTQGYQQALLPARLVRDGLERFNVLVAQQGAAFAARSPEDQDALLTQLEKGELDLAPLPGPLFFQTLLDLSIEGFFADPLYGGNRDMVGWRLVGFPGYYASYVTEIERHNMPFRKPPQSLADLARAHAEDAAHGHPPSPQQLPHGHAAP